MPKATTMSVLISFALLAACAGPITPDDTTWQATLTATGPRDRLTGNVGVLSQSDRLSANIQIKNAPPGAILTWQLRTGSCAQAGDLIGGRAVYPALTADTLGAASAVTVVDTHLSSDGQYQASVLDAGGLVVACGELQRS
ncbi:MAG: hypothetical protein P8174_10470 [Gemmatimonadota bacterium]